MRMLEAAETQMPQEGHEVSGQFDLSIGGVGQASMAMPEASLGPNIFDRAAHLGYSALSYVRDARDRITFPGRLGHGLAMAIGLAAASYGIGATEAVASKTHPINPASTIIPIDAYYGTMLQQTTESPFRIQHLALSAHRLVRSGPCVYDSNGLPNSPVKSTLSTPAGERDTFCATRPGGHTTQLFIPRGKIISNPSMDFQPVLTQVGEQAANSVSLPPTSHGAPTQITINLNPKRHTGEADVFYGRNPLAAGTKQVKELKFVTHGHRETVRTISY